MEFGGLFGIELAECLLTSGYKPCTRCARALPYKPLSGAGTFYAHSTGFCREAGFECREAGELVKRGHRRDKRLGKKNLSHSRRAKLNQSLPAPQ